MLRDLLYIGILLALDIICSFGNMFLFCSKQWATKGDEMVEALAKAVSTRKLFLYLRKDEWESHETLKLLGEFENLNLPVEIDYLNGGDTITPWLVTPLSFFRGLAEIQQFVEQERLLPVTRQCLEQE